MLLLLGLALAVPVRATVNAFSFDDSTTTSNWVMGAWGGQGTEGGWDGTQDHTGNGGGSLRVVDIWQNGDQLVDLGWWGSQPWTANMPIDLTRFHDVFFYLKWDTNSTADISVFESGAESLRLWTFASNPTNFWQWIDIGPINIPASASNGWVKIDVPVSGSLPGIELALGLGLKKYSGTGLTNTFAFWVDDFVLDDSEPSLIPVLQITHPTTGLNLVAVNGLNNRESIRTVQGQSWVGRGSNPVTYAFTLKQGVDGLGSGAQFQNHIFLVSNPGPETSPDWYETNVIFLDLESNTNRGGTTWTFRYKTNQYAGNTMLYDTNVIPGFLADTNLTGKWSVTFLNDTNVTMTAPSGNSTNFNLPAWLPPLFSDTVYAYFGVQANNSAAIDQWSIYREIEIAGTANPLDDGFEDDPVLNIDLWSVVAAYPVGVVVVPPTSAFWVNWTLPDSGYAFVSAPTANPNNWPTVPGVVLRQFGVRRWVLIDQTNLPGVDGGYFTLVRRRFTQLQVLLPGETNAPGTVSGKVGTPTPVSLSSGGSINLTVNACDPKWNIVSSYGDTIHVTTTDTQAILPADTTLAGGTTMQQFQLKTQGTTTFTATNLDSLTVLPNTSSPVVVGP